MRTYQEWMTEYAQSHTHPLNQKIHQICVPIIFFNVLAVCWFVPIPFIDNAYINLTTAGACLALAFYWSINLRVFLCMLIILLVILGVNMFYQESQTYLYVNIFLFVLAWIGQFYGHRVEGVKPAFIEDLLFLLIGPIWVLRKLGIRF